MNKDSNNDIFGDYKCPHCGSTKGIWFDRSFSLDSEGNEIPEESFANRCESCGKNIDASPEYYNPKILNNNGSAATKLELKKSNNTVKRFFKNILSLVLLIFSK